MVMGYMEPYTPPRPLDGPVHLVAGLGEDAACGLEKPFSGFRAQRLASSSQARLQSPSTPAHRIPLCGVKSWRIVTGRQAWAPVLEINLLSGVKCLPLKVKRALKDRGSPFVICVCYLCATLSVVNGHSEV